MKSILLILTFFVLEIYASQRVVFGAISPVEKHIMQKQLAPLISYLEQSCGVEIEFRISYSYEDTIEKFISGDFDIGFIGPSPYLIAQERAADSLFLLAELQNRDEDSFKSIIVAKAGSSIHSLEALSNKSFAFGSPDSTLSYYVPMNMLIESDIAKKLKRYLFLGQHDRVAQYVIMGKYDAGAIKKSVADKYSRYLQKVASSKSYPDFLIVAHKSMSPVLREKFKRAFLELKDRDTLLSIKESAVGFKETNRSNYSELKAIMKRVDAYTK